MNTNPTPASPALSSIKKKILYISLFIITTVIILILGEITARFFIIKDPIPKPPPVSTIDPYSANPYIVGMRPFLYFHIPGSEYIQSRSYYAVKYHINSSGFRGPDIPPKAAGIKRLIIIGDSIVEGHGCEFEETFSWKLNKKAKTINWEVVNLGVQGASPVYFAANMERYLAAEPDAALIVIFENDLYDDRIQEQNYFSKPFMDNPNILYPNNKKHLISDMSKLYLLINQSFFRIKHKSLIQIINANRNISIHNEEQQKLDKLSPWLVAPSMFKTQWEMSSQYLQFSVDQFKEHKIPVMIISIALCALAPNPYPVYETHAMTLNHKIETWAASHNIPFFSMAPIFKKLLAENASDIVIPDDGHPTPNAHSIICDYLWNWLQPKKK